MNRGIIDYYDAAGNLWTAVITRRYGGAQDKVRLTAFQPGAQVDVHNVVFSSSGVASTWRWPGA